MNDLELQAQIAKHRIDIFTNRRLWWDQYKSTATLKFSVFIDQVNMGTGQINWWVEQGVAHNGRSHLNLYKEGIELFRRELGYVQVSKITKIEESIKTLLEQKIPMIALEEGDIEQWMGKLITLIEPCTN